LLILFGLEKRLYYREIILMRVPLLDLKPQYLSIKNEIMSSLDEVITSQHFILGPNVEKLEQE